MWPVCTVGMGLCLLIALAAPLSVFIFTYATAGPLFVYSLKRWRRGERL